MIDWVATHALQGGLLSEQLDPHTGAPLSVSPLTWSHAELVLTGVHIGSYGADLDGETLGHLLERLVTELPDVRFRLSADGDPLHELEREFDAETGRGKLTATPVLRAQRTLRVEVGPEKERARSKDASVEVPLP